MAGGLLFMWRSTFYCSWEYRNCLGFLQELMGNLGNGAGTCQCKGSYLPRVTYHGSHPKQISATDNYVIFVEGDHNESRVGVWKIPPLHPIGHTSASLGVLPANAWFALPRVDDVILVNHYGGLDDWYLTGGVGRTRCIIDGYGFSRSAFLRVELPLNLGDTHSTDNDGLDFHVFDFPTSESIFGSLGVCNENAISVWTSPFGIQFHATRRTNIVNRRYMPVDLTPSPRSASVFIKMPIVPDIAAFCPVSGRLCYLLHGDSSPIFITDYLSKNITSEVWFDMHLF